MEDVKINVKIKLAGLWAAVMFLYVYADLFGFYKTGFIEELIAGELLGIQITQVFLLGIAIFMAIPSIMVFLPIILKAKANRWANIIVGISYAGVLLTTTMINPGGIWAYYMLYVIVEAVLIALMVWYAWKWPKQGRG